MQRRVHSTNKTIFFKKFEMDSIGEMEHDDMEHLRYTEGFHKDTLVTFGRYPDSLPQLIQELWNRIRKENFYNANLKTVLGTREGRYRLLGVK